MNRISAFLQSLGRIRIPRWVVVVAGTVMISILIWFLGPLIGVAKWTPLAKWWIRLIVILLIVGVVAGFYALREIRRGRDNARMMEELGPTTETEPTDDYSAEDIKAMNERARNALEVMRSTRIGKNREFVYELPWYLIIGPPGAGKTTALHNAGLQFPVTQEAGAAPIRGLGGTRNCEWWFTDQAVLIDTAGRYTLQDSHAVTDGKAWQGFLDILARYRPRQPVTGILVALSVQDLIGGDESHIAAHGRAIRARLNEVAQRLGVRAPVYVVVTKLDLLAGFNEFFDDAGQLEREQVWGQTFDIEASRAGATSAEFDAGFGQLIERLDDRLLSRVQAERDIQRRGLIFGFPQQIVGLKGPLATILQIIGRETKYEPTPLIRGVYLTSAAQFGRPIDRLMGAISTKFGLEVAAQGAAAGTGRSYFLRDLLHKVVFQEGALTDRDPKTERRRLWMRNGAIIGGAALVALTSVIWLANYLHTANLLKQLDTKATHLQRTVAGLPSGDVSDSDLTQALPALEEARALPFASTAPKNMRPPDFAFGLGRRRAVQTQVDAAYVNLLNQQMLPRLILSLEDQLRTALQANATPQADNRPAIYTLLRTYLMLGRAPGAPLEKAQIETWFAGDWANTYARAEDDATRDALQRHLDSLLSNRISAPTLDRDLIAQARERVRSLGPGERAYARMLSDPNLEDLPAFNLVDIPSVGNSGLFARRSGKSLTLGVPGLYRRQVFFSTVLPAIAKAASQSVNESWVTDEKPPPGGVLPVASEIGRTKDEILVAYLKDFTRQWDDFINDITISGEHGAGERIQIATRPPSPVKLLINALAAETNLTPPQLSARSAGGGAAAMRVAALFSQRIYTGMSRLNAAEYAVNGSQARRGPPGPLDEVIAHFQWLQDMNPAQGPSPLDPALQALASVGDSAIAAQAASGLGDPLLQRTKTSSAMEATARLDQTAATLPPIVQGMFTGFVRASSAQLNKSVKQSIQQSYAAELLPQCQSITSQGFPFSDSDHQASLDDVSRLLRPAGLMDQFTQNNLAGMVDSASGGWTITPAGRVLGLQAASVREFERADRIRKRMFMPGDVRPNVRFLLEPVQVGGDASSVALSVDGAPAAFDSVNRRPVEMKWPGPSPGVTVTFQKRGGGPAMRTWSGDFALFRMVGGSHIVASSNKSLTFEISEGGSQATFTMRFLNTGNPFILSDLRAFSCPGRL